MVLSAKQFPDRRESQQEAHAKQHEGGNIHAGHVHSFFLPKPGENEPHDQPRDDPKRRLSGQRANRIVKIQQPADGARHFGSQRYQSENCAADACCQDSGCAWPVWLIRFSRLREDGRFLPIRHLPPPIRMMTSPPRTGAYLLKNAPNAPAIPVATNAATVKANTLTRILR